MCYICWAQQSRLYLQIQLFIKHSKPAVCGVPTRFQNNARHCQKYLTKGEHLKSYNNYRNVCVISFASWTDDTVVIKKIADSECPLRICLY